MPEQAISAKPVATFILRIKCAAIARALGSTWFGTDFEKELKLNQLCRKYPKLLRYIQLAGITFADVVAMTKHHK